ncbi:hypothetical protein AMS68_004834 [Peltaster fructicola]|uniref:HECT-type E3 ubiquitin transferase n=1 Tax=Peltaster fructicola TaxID=286661 RepID=A0A6H0XX20_9PEZI|nr:hypothetical protein AMS68_004834 [Peltaster fructicola]
MYQTFTGTSRRPRQVNLSGRSGNPFAAAGLGGPKSAIDSAKEDRLRRQQERDRVQASKHIQRAWRGHSSRRKTFSLWRSVWDDTEKAASEGGSYESPGTSLSQLDRLLLFFSPSKDAQDAQRLRWYGMRQANTADKFPCDGEEWSRAYSRLVRACLKALRVDNSSEGPSETDETLRILAFAARRAKSMDKVSAMDYYTVLTSLGRGPPNALQHALLAPLGTTQAYAGLAILLAQPLQPALLDLLKDHVEPRMLASALGETISSAKTAKSRLWLLGNVIYLCGTSSVDVMHLIAQLLGALADDVEFEAVPMTMDNVPFDREVLSKITTGFPLNTYLADQLASLVNQESIRNLLVRDVAATSARLYANLALTLLRCYPRRADDIRMWLYLGPTSSSDVPATQYFWRAMKQSAVFASVLGEPRSVLSTVRSSATQKDDWIVILIFLELYTFLVKIMDDDQFLGRGVGKQSAIPATDLSDLVLFLKHLGFTLCFDAAELSEGAPILTRDTGSLSSHFSPSSKPPPRFTESKSLTIAGLTGVDAEYLKGLTTGLLRAIYDRDSRRRFLDKDIWLMTSRFDMSKFISLVVEEEEKRRLAFDEDEDDQEIRSEEDEPTNGRESGTYRAQVSKARAQQKLYERRRLESVAPRLEILQNLPFFIPFHTRVEIFREFVLHDQVRRRGGQADADTWRAGLMFHPSGTGRNQLSRHHAEIKRKQEFEDAYAQFYDLGAALKEPIQITFLDEFGLQEAGIDGGGVTKEFLTSVISQAFDPSSSGMDKYFIENEAHLLYPNPTAIDDARLFLKETFTAESQIRPFIRQLLRKYEFLGRIIGKCLYEGILVDVSFAGFFLKKWALTGGLGSSTGESGYRASINDLRDFDEALYRGLLEVKNAPDASEFGLTFTVDDMIGSMENRQVVERELIPDGADKPVTNENRLIYINRLSWYRLQGQSAAQTNAFLKGLSSIIQPTWLSMFNQNELQTLIGGAHSGIDVQDLRRNTSYGGVYVIGDDGQEHPSVKLFWKIMDSMSEEDRCKVLKFVTSTPRGPLLGFANLNPRFSIWDSGSDENRFPTTSTCVNLLKLPMYRSEATMRRKLLEAVHSGAGFDLS